MKRFYQILSWFAFYSILLALSACDGDYTAIPDKDIYFNLSTLIDQQVQLLDSLKPKVGKSLLSNGVKEKKEVTIEKWSQELYLFKDADINKVAYDGLYNLEETSNDKDGFDKRYYKATSNNLSTQELSVVELDNKVYDIQIEVKQKNILYSTQKTLHLTFKEVPDLGICIEKYEIQGNQASIFGHKNDFDIKGVIELN